MTPEGAHRVATDWTKQADIAASPERIAAIAGALAAAHQVDPETGRHVVVDTNGNRMRTVENGAAVDLDLVGYLRELTADDPRGPRPKAQKTSEQPVPTANGFVKITIGATTSYRRADDPMVAFQAALQTARAAETAKAVATWPNPWAKGSENRARQQVITSTNPELAALYKAEAGA